MKKSIINFIKPLALLMTIAITLIACEKDFVNIESDITGAENFTTNSKMFPFIAYNKKVGPVQTNGLSSYVLGTYNDPNFGLTSAGLVTQIAPDEVEPEFEDNLEVKSVNLYIPYFSTVEGSDDDGNTTYTLDSLFGDASSGYKLSIYKNEYFLRDLDPESDFEETQAYYSNAYTDLNLSAFEGELIYESSANGFTPSDQYVAIQEIPLEETELEDLEDNRAPGLYLDLTNQEFGLDQWKDLLVQADGSTNPNLSSTNNFKNAFRGLIFKVEQIDNNDGNMIFLNIDTTAKIDLRYETDVEDTTTNERERDTYTFNLNSNKFNIFETLTSNITLTDGNEATGDDQLFLKGFEGSMTVLDLFNGNIIDEDNNTQDALEYFRSKEEQWLINEATLSFYVNLPSDQSGTIEPDRVTLYNLNNNSPIIDYFFDSSSNTADPFNSHLIYSPKLERDEDENGVKYKIRLTEHINDILLKDSTNVKLGLFVTTNINYTTTSKILNTTNNDDVNIIPRGSTLAPEGTILYGNTTSVPDDLKATFEIYYTEPEN
ncbi:DUF4270 domain-containing protein [uncultured Olleya sp.]|uniref:DUF4270 domain-containing protein n=1 Tax=uncultured Olleya sp. TaxID=757243 RepID=UPI002595A1C9|nr:DUF4270 domain-containing protein [uncultured Olleya sp.]